jgi:hypothetical protein
MADYLSQMESITTSMARLMLGDNDTDDEAADIRRRFVLEVSTRLLPFVSWGDFDEILKKIKVEAAGEKDLDKNNSDSGLDDSIDDEML